MKITKIYYIFEMFMEMHHFHAKLSSVLLKNGTRNFQNSPPFERSTCFFVTISGNFERF